MLVWYKYIVMCSDGNTIIYTQFKYGSCKSKGKPENIYHKPQILIKQEQKREKKIKAIN